MFNPLETLGIIGVENMRKINILILLLCAIFALVSLSSCDPSMLALIDGDTNEEHVHNYGYLEYTQDAEGNITKSGTCACGEKLVETATNEEVFCFTDGKLSVAWIDENTHIYLKGEWVIPDTIGETEVTAIDDNAFKNLMNITSLKLPETVTSIGDSAFYSCSALTTINIPEGVNSIGSQAFSMCTKLTAITIDAENENFKFKDGILYNYDKTTLLAYPKAEGDIVIPGSVTTIGKYAFDSCWRIDSVSIPNSVTTIEDCAFADCNYITSLTIPDSVETIGTGAFYGCRKLEELTIGTGVQDCGEGIFSYDGPSRTHVIFKSGITTIPKKILKDAIMVNEVTIPLSVTKIGEKAFSGCSNLSMISLDVTVKMPEDSGDDTGELDYDPYESWEAITKGQDWDLGLPENFLIHVHEFHEDGIVQEGDKVYRQFSCSCGNKQLEELTIEDVFTFTDILKDGRYIAISVKDGFNLYGSWTVPTTVGGYNINRLQKEGFKNQTLLTEIIVPDEIKNINIGTFQGCTNLASVTLHNGITTIPSNVFDQCTSLAKINTEDTSIRTVGSYAFRGCSSLTSIVIPDVKYEINGNKENRTTIGTEAFKDCSSLTSITMPSVCRIDKYAFYNCTKLETADLASVTKIGEKAFFRCALTYVDISSISDASDIGNSVFMSCPITEIKFSDQLTTIPQGMFSNFKKLTTLTVPDNVTSIGRTAFFNCTNLVSVTISSSVTSIGASAFGKCTSLASINIPASVTSIGSEAFSRCSSLTSIDVDPNNPKYSSEGGALYNKDKTVLISYSCASGEVKISNKVQTISNQAFDSCVKMTKITIPASVKKIENQPFFGCSSLKTIVFEGTVTQWKAIEKATLWNDSIPADIIICNNGNVYL